MQGFFEFLKSLGAARIAAMAAVTVAMVGFFAFLILRVTAPQMTPLFTDLSFEDSASIVKDLERQAIPYELKNDGAIVLVPKDRVPRLRMKLAEAGLPKGGGVGYEIFDKSDALGATSFVQNINHLRALEGELARTIRGIDRVQAARVHLVLPENDPLRQQLVPSSASVFIRHQASVRVSELVPQVKMLVANGIAGLSYDKVTVVTVPVERTEALSGGGAELVSLHGLWLHRDSVRQVAWLIYGLVAAVVVLAGVVAALLLRQRPRVYALQPVATAKRS